MQKKKYNQTKEKKMSSKKITLALTIVLGLSLIGAIVFYLQVNPNLIQSAENVQVFRFVSTSMEPTILAGNYVLVDKQVNPRESSADYPDSDVIAFLKPSNTAEIIVHRIVSEEEKDGILYFYTKGDANGINKYPSIPTPAEYDPWQTDGVVGIREDLVVGKVVNYNYPIILFNLGFWLMIIISVIAAIAIIAFYFVNRSRKSQNRIKQLEERVKQLETEKTKVVNRSIILNWVIT
jgi:signal peptidase I